MRRDLLWLVLAVLGGVAFVVALGFRMGTVSNIGSAVYPLMLSGTIVLISGYALLAGGDAASKPFDVRPFGAIVSAVLLFVLLVERVGLVPAVVVSMVAAYAGQSEGGYLSFLVYAGLFALGTWLLFSFVLGLPLPAVKVG
ncbi:tripartite tricarboxylate transporter TctB family protein [Lutibaculum baratangense]|uniref:DUF1468 domain-containing protein n=1 Tax=Lutibaculum baratangense AMV1 TaxID=631454 RepID=V4RFI1_9HYPH|nr:tripartite tricarboxylate transporter TctB family protein [Lutibaculum baratangense]ESR24891.1 hypothetical protein N177_2214 [Lutibaculum baratangense AMV1]